MIRSYSRRRRLIYFLLYASGISALVLRLKPRQRPLVLLAHRVLESSDPAAALLVASGEALSKRDFERRIRFLVNHFQPVSMQDYVAHTAIPHSSVLTFDDGYRDNFTIALDVLRDHGVPMHLFLTTGFVNGLVVPWVDRVARVCSTAEIGNYKVVSLDLELRFTEPTGRYIGLGRLCRALKSLDPAHIDRALAELESLPGVLPLRACGGLFLSPSELAAPDDLVSFGAHSVTHANFRFLDHAAMVDEVERSGQWIELATGRPVHTFAYPYGFASECSRSYFHWTLGSPSARWRHVFGTGSGRAGDPLEDRRLSLNLQPFYVFHVEVSGAWALLAGH